MNAGKQGKRKILNGHLSHEENIEGHEHPACSKDTHGRKWTEDKQG